MTQSICTTCPSNYYSGYGYGVSNSYNSITNRCYYFSQWTNTQSTYSGAVSNCQAPSATYSSLVTIQNTLEMGVASSFTGNSLAFWVLILE